MVTTSTEANPFDEEIQRKLIDKTTDSVNSAYRLIPKEKLRELMVEFFKPQPETLSEDDIQAQKKELEEIRMKFNTLFTSVGYESVEGDRWDELFEILMIHCENAENEILSVELNGLEFVSIEKIMKDFMQPSQPGNKVTAAGMVGFGDKDFEFGPHMKTKLN